MIVHDRPISGNDEHYVYYEQYYVAAELARLSNHTSDELQSRIQAVYMWLITNDNRDKC